MDVKPPRSSRNNSLAEFALRQGQLHNKREHGTPLPEDVVVHDAGVRPEDRGLAQLALRMGANRIARAEKQELSMKNTGELDERTPLEKEEQVPEQEVPAVDQGLANLALRLGQLRNNREHGTPLPEDIQNSEIKHKDQGLANLALRLGQLSNNRENGTPLPEDLQPKQSP